MLLYFPGISPKGSGVVRERIAKPAIASLLDCSVRCSVSTLFKENSSLSKIPDIVALYEVTKPCDKRVYHNNSTCPAGRMIPEKERRSGTSGYRICENCKERNDRK